MPPKKKNPRKRSRPDDDNSTGVGADDQQVQATNPRTGRPIRRSAGRVFQGFTNTLDAVSDDELSGPEYDPENPPSHAAKKQRTPSPPLDDGILDVESDAGLSDVSIGADYGATLSPSYTDVDGDLRNVSLTFNVPRGHSGPLVVKLDLNNLLHGTHQRRSDRRSSSKTLVAAASPIIKKSSSPVPQSRKGFLDLPAEIRNQIYALVFVEETSFNFDYPKNFAHCAALLRTCKQVNLEGCTVLYSENLFYFRRNTTRRVKHWYTSGNSSEIGFRDVHYFLSSIGPTNISYLRDVVFVLDDVTPSSNPYLKTAWDRRYVNDEPLIACLKLLAAHGRLRTIKLAPYGRRPLYPDLDERFMQNIKALRADEVKIVQEPDSSLQIGYHIPKISASASKAIVDAVTRKRKLYEESTYELKPTLPASFAQRMRCHGY